MVCILRLKSLADASGYNESYSLPAGAIDTTGTICS